MIGKRLLNNMHFIGYQLCGLRPMPPRTADWRFELRLLDQRMLTITKVTSPASSSTRVVR